VRIARNAGPKNRRAFDFESRAATPIRRDLYRQKRDKKSVVAAARDSVQTAEEARVISVKQKAEEEAQASQGRQSRRRSARSQSASGCRR